MPKIQGYEDHVVAQGSINTQASPDDFGFGIGKNMEKLGYAVSDAAEKMYQVHEAQDVSNVHVNMAKARAEWTQTLQERERTAVPGDDTFSDTLMKDMNDWFEKSADSAKTPRGREVYRNLAANMAGEFGQRAVFIQANLAAQDATNKYGSLVDSLGQAAFADPSQVKSVLEQGRAAIDDPSGIFSKIPQPAREKFKQQLEEDANYAAANGFVQHNPEALLKSIAPEELAKFKPWNHLLQSQAAPGGHVQISKETMAGAQPIIEAAAKENVNPAVLLAIRDAGGSTEDAGKQAADLDALLSRYGGSYPKAVAAFAMGTEAFDAIVKADPQTWMDQLPEQTKTYVDGVMVKSGMAPSAAPPAEADMALKTAAASDLGFFNALPWQKQDAILKEAVHLQNARLTTAKQARAEAEYQRGEQQDAILNEMVQKVFDPKTYGTLNQKDVLADKTLTYQQKEHVLALKAARVRELKAGAGSGNPGAFRDTVLRIHADPTDPNKIRGTEPLVALYRAGSINYSEFNQLKTELDRVKDGGTSTFAKRVQEAREAARVGFMQSISGKLRPEESVSAYYKFTFDLERKIADKVAKNEDPSVLLDPSSREFVLKPESLSGFMGSSKQALGAEVTKVVDRATATLPSYKDFDKLKSGDQFVDPDGAVRRKP